MFSRVGIVGGGAWGTALGQLCAQAGGEALLWARETDVVDGLNERHENALFLPGQKLHPFLRATADLSHLGNAGLWLFVVPAQHARGVLRQLQPHWRGQPVVLCAKGIEIASGRLMTEVTAVELPGASVAVLSGPSFAAEVARGQPTAVAIATIVDGLGARIAERLGRPMFRPYASDDPIGAEVGGAVKNVLAIACGIALGRGMGDNARAALITRGLAEMTRFGVALGGKPATFAGLAGIGDLVLTCSSPQSRNMSLGMALGEGRDLDDILASRRSVAEGEATSAAVVRRATMLGIDMPICAAVDAVLHHGADLDATIAGLLARPLRAEE